MVKIDIRPPSDSRVPVGVRGAEPVCLLCLLCLSLSLSLLLSRAWPFYVTFPFEGGSLSLCEKRKQSSTCVLDKEKGSCLNRGAKLPSGLLCIVDIARPRGRLVLEPSATLATLQ